MSSMKKLAMYLMKSNIEEVEKNGELTLGIKDLEHPHVYEAYGLQPSEVMLALKVLKKHKTTEAVFGPSGCFLYDKGELQ